MPGKKATGTNTAISTSAVAITAPDTSRIACDVDYMADVLLAPLTAGVYVHQRKVRRMPISQIAQTTERRASWAVGTV